MENRNNNKSEVKKLNDFFMRYFFGSEDNKDVLSTR